MRIGVNATFTHSDPVGLGIATRETVRELLKQRKDGLVVYTASKELKKDGGGRVKAVSELLSPDKRTRGNLLRLLWCQTLLPLYLSADGIDILYSTVEEGVLWGGLRQVVTCYDILPLIYPEMYPRKKYVFRYIVPLQLRASSAVICASQNTRADITRRYCLRNKPVFVVHCGLDHGRFRPLDGELARSRYGLERFVLYVGDMRPYKNLGRAVEAFGRAGLPGHRFVIAGKKDNVFYPRVRKRVSDLGLDNRVVFPGYVPDENLPQLYSAAEAFVFPSLYEGFGLPPLEAMACGCPVVTTRAASLPEVCGDAAYYVDPYSVDGIAEGIRKVVTTPGLKKQLVQRGLEQAKRFTWAKTAGRVLEILEYVVRRRTR
jgi:glycosyltransferase involved in cell wall biosynthesis